MTQPYIDEKITETSFIRTFTPNPEDYHEFIWHRDRENRKVRVLGNPIGWKFQFDEEVPFEINSTDTIIIPRMIYHRLIPGKTVLQLEIEEFEGELECQ
jgi:hypothetical protein